MANNLAPTVHFFKIFICEHSNFFLVKEVTGKGHV